MPVLERNKIVEEKSHFFTNVRKSQNSKRREEIAEEEKLSRRSKEELMSQRRTTISEESISSKVFVDNLKLISKCSNLVQFDAAIGSKTKERVYRNMLRLKL